MEPLSPEQIANLTATDAPAPAVQAVPEVQPEQPKPSAALKAAPADVFTETLRDGRVITLQKPAKATALHVAKCLGVHSINGALETYYRSMMWVRQINGLPIPFLATQQAFEGLAEALGDDGLDQISQVVMMRGYAEPQLDVEALKNA